MAEQILIAGHTLASIHLSTIQSSILLKPPALSLKNALIFSGNYLINMSQALNAKILPNEKNAN